MTHVLTLILVLTDKRSWAHLRKFGGKKFDEPNEKFAVKNYNFRIIDGRGA
jgi:hypothetical protein